MKSENENDFGDKNFRVDRIHGIREEYHMRLSLETIPIICGFTDSLVDIEEIWSEIFVFFLLK